MGGFHRPSFFFKRQFMLILGFKEMPNGNGILEGNVM